ncbi:hypothetical protein C1H70_12695 [Halomonas urumqiensis]|uniref:Uncharacterized protein n=2 Tax=Halomonas urumqiensis TaxID=1684789 RepID=A0A2N7UFJ9_9GAMM|nr:hypothetical protein C1H70_12695 [Halomonas urumqiensis]PTB03830.1 hypothetical protein C6V82_04980 [Halomonas urumqiensis]
MILHEVSTLMSDSIPLLWLSYGFLSLMVLLTGYLGLAFLPRLPRLVITWLVAGVMWIPSRFRLPLIEEGEFYTGLAPAIMVAAIAVLEGNGSVFLPAALLVAVGALLGGGVGMLLWWRGRGRNQKPHADREERDSRPVRKRGGNDEREEPVIG